MASRASPAASVLWRRQASCQSVDARPQPSLSRRHRVSLALEPRQPLFEGTGPRPFATQYRLVISAGDARRRGAGGTGRTLLGSGARGLRGLQRIPPRLDLFLRISDTITEHAAGGGEIEREPRGTTVDPL